MHHPRPLLLIGALCAATLSLAACSGDPPDRERGAPQVGYVTVAASAVPITAELGGRTVAYESSEVRPQVNGLIRKRLFTEGGLVRAGQPLFQIAAHPARADHHQTRQRHGRGKGV